MSKETKESKESSKNLSLSEALTPTTLKAISKLTQEQQMAVTGMISELNLHKLLMPKYLEAIILNGKCAPAIYSTFPTFMKHKVLKEVLDSVIQYPAFINELIIGMEHLIVNDSTYDNYSLLPHAIAMGWNFGMQSELIVKIIEKWNQLANIDSEMVNLNNLIFLIYLNRRSENPTEGYDDLIHLYQNKDYEILNIIHEKIKFVSIYLKKKSTLGNPTFLDSDKLFFKVADDTLSIYRTIIEEEKSLSLGNKLAMIENVEHASDIYSNYCQANVVNSKANIEIFVNNALYAHEIFLTILFLNFTGKEYQEENLQLVLHNMQYISELSVITNFIHTLERDFSLKNLYTQDNFTALMRYQPHLIPEVAAICEIKPFTTNEVDLLTEHFDSLRSYARSEIWKNASAFFTSYSSETKNNDHANIGNEEGVGSILKGYL